MFEHVTILSPGLLGASLAMAIREKNLAHSIHIWAHRETTRQKCRDKPWQDNVCETFEQAVKDADLVIICSPVEHIIGLTGDISPYLKKGALVTDVGSTKEEICHPCHTALSSDAYFVGAHPMAGSEKVGLNTPIQCFLNASLASLLLCQRVCLMQWLPFKNSGRHLVCIHIV